MNTETRTMADLVPAVLTAMPGRSTTHPNTQAYKPRPEWRAKWLGLVEHNAEVRQMAEAVELFAMRFFRNDRISPTLVLAGKTGVGKTHCAKRVMRWAQSVSIEAWSRGYWPNKVPTVCFVRWADFIESESDGVERDAREADLLVLDDVGSETDRFKSGAPIDKLCQILGCREGRFTLISSNLPIAEWSKRDARVADRLLRGSIVVRIDSTKSWALKRDELRRASL